MTFSEKVKIAYSESPGEATYSSLPESKPFDEIRKEFDSSDKSYENKVAAAHKVADLIRESIKYSSHTAKQPELTPEWIESSHTTNCHGHSIITSECLEQLDIPHRIGFANQHSFLLMEDIDSGAVNLIDTPVKNLCTDITPALDGSALEEINRQQGGATFIWGNVILFTSRFSNKHQALERRPWLSFLAADEGPLFLTDDRDDVKNRLILRTYDPDIGRQVLLAYDNFIHAIATRDIRRAHNSIQALDGTYPDIDKRNKLRAPTKLIRHLGSTAFVDEALQDIEIIERSVTAFSNDLNLNLWPIDQRRDLGSKVESAEILQQALKQYDQMLEERKDACYTTSGIENRMRKAKNRLDRITN